jgi:hypothetical protein
MLHLDSDIARRPLGFKHTYVLRLNYVLHKQISIDELKKKRVLLLISGLDISRDDISILKSIYDGIRENGYDEYKIVWIPIVEQWTDGLQKKFEMLRLCIAMVHSAILFTTSRPASSSLRRRGTSRIDLLSW